MVLILLADGFEECEALIPLDILRRADIDAKTVGIGKKEITGAHLVHIIADLSEEDAEKVKDIDCVILPGGMPGAMNLDGSDFTDRIIKRVWKEGGRLAALCAAPLVLGRRGFMVGRRAVCYPGFEDELDGAIILNRSVVTDGRITTGASMGAAEDFAFELVRIFKGQNKVDDVRSLLLLERAGDVYYEIDERERLASDFFEKKPEKNKAERKKVEIHYESLVSDALDGLRDYIDNLFGEDKLKGSPYEFVPPPVDLLYHTQEEWTPGDNRELSLQTARRIADVLPTMNLWGNIEDVNTGCLVSRFIVDIKTKTTPGYVCSKAGDIAKAFGFDNPIRIVYPIGERNLYGFEIPNPTFHSVSLRSLIEDDEFKEALSPVTVALGRNLHGLGVYVNLAETTPILIGGDSGTGKTMTEHAMISSLLYKSSPMFVKLMLINAKDQSFDIYEGLPNLLYNVVNTCEEALARLEELSEEISERSRLFDAERAHSIDSYNYKMLSASRFDKILPRIVIFIDELAPIMSYSRERAERALIKIAATSIASGISLVISTSTPDADTLSSNLKGWIGARISLASSNIDNSMAVLARAGAETLIGQGDMLYAPTTYTESIRLQGAYTSHSDRRRLVKYLEKNGQRLIVDDPKSLLANEDFISAVELVFQAKKASAAMLVRKMNMSYPTALCFVEAMFSLGIVSDEDWKKERELIMDVKGWLNLLAENG